MQERFHINRVPKYRRITSHISRVFKSAVDGFDGVFTVVKAGFAYVFVGGLLKGTYGAFTAFSASPNTLAHLSEALRMGLKPLAGPIIGVSAAASLLFVASALKDEYDKKKEEDEKLKELALIEQEDQKLTSLIQKRLKHHLIRRKIEEYSSEPEDHLEEVPDLSKLGNEELLKFYLRNYLQRLGLLKIGIDKVKSVARSKRIDGKLPGQAGIERLIKTIVGIDKNDEFYAEKLTVFLKNIKVIKANDDFEQRLKYALNVKESLRLPESLNLKPPSKIKTRIRQFISATKAAIFILARANTGIGIVVWSFLLAAGIGIGMTPVGWPILLAAGLFGLLSGVASFIYKKKGERAYNYNASQIDAKFKDHKIRYELLYKLDHLNQKNYSNIKGNSQHSEESLEDDFHIPNPLKFDNLAADFRELKGYLPKNEIPKDTAYVSLQDRIRFKVHAILQALFGLGTGVVVAVSITTVVGLALTMAFPAIGIPFLAVTIPGLIIGCMLGARYARQNQKASSKAAQEEIAKKAAVERREQELSKSLGNNVNVANELAKSHQQLISELISCYLKCAAKYDEAGEFAKQDSISGEDEKMLALLNKKEKLLRIIEDTTGIKRIRTPVSETADNYDNTFYAKLTLYLEKDSKTKDLANEQITKLKSAITGSPQEKINTAGVSLNEPWSFKRVNRFFLKHVAPVIGALSVAIPLGIMLFGTFAVVPVGIILVTMMTFYGVSKYLEYKQAKNLEAIAEKEVKLTLIEKTVQLRKKVPEHAKSSTYSKWLASKPAEERLIKQQKVATEAVNAPKKSFKEDPGSYAGTRSNVYAAPKHMSNMFTGVGDSRKIDQEVSRRIKAAPSIDSGYKSTNDFVDLLDKQFKQSRELKSKSSPSLVEQDPQLRAVAVS